MRHRQILVSATALTLLTLLHLVPGAMPVAAEDRMGDQASNQTGDRTGDQSGDESGAAAAAKTAGETAGQAAIDAAGQAAVPVEPPSKFAEIIDVDLVNLEAWVTDESGEPVSGLSRDAFSILHDDAPVPISHFSEIVGRVPKDATIVPGWEDPAEATGPPTIENHLVVVIDLFRLTKTSRKRVIRDLREFLGREEVPAEQVMILHVEGGLSIDAPFGSSRAGLDQVLRGLEDRSPSTANLAADHRQVLGSLQDLWTDLNRPSGSASIRSVVGQVTGPTASQGAAGTSGTEPGAPGSSGVASGLACEDFVDRAEPILVRWSQKESSDTIAGLNRLIDTASFLSGLDGPKTLIYVSNGLGLIPGVAATDFVRGVCPGYQTDLEIDALSAEVSNSFFELARRMSSNRITVHTIQGADPGAESSGGAGQTSADRRGIRSFARSLGSNAKRGLSLLAEETGGRAVFETTGRTSELTKIADEMGSYYSLAYSPPAGEESPNHQISIQLSDSAYRVRHRRAYSDKTPDQWLTERLESALYLGMVSNPLAVRLGAGDVTSKSDNLHSLPLHVMVPVESLAFRERSGRPMAQVMIRVMALNTRSRTLAMTDRRLFLPLPSEKTAEMMDLRVDLELEGGVQMLAVGVRDQTSRETSLISTTIQVGTPAPGS